MYLLERLAQLLSLSEGDVRVDARGSDDMLVAQILPLGGRAADDRAGVFEACGLLLMQMLMLLMLVLVVERVWIRMMMMIVLLALRAAIFDLTLARGVVMVMMKALR